MAPRQLPLLTTATRDTRLSSDAPVAERTRHRPRGDDEQRMFFSLLQRVCEYHVDQFLLMRVDTDPYSRYVDIGLHPQAEEADIYEPVTSTTVLSNQRLGPSH